MTQQFKDILTGVKPGICDNPSTDFVEDGILDSLDVMNIITVLEEGYEIDFDPDDIEPDNFASVSAIWLLLQKYLEEKENA
jgi:acyl carrier protein